MRNKTTGVRSQESGVRRNGKDLSCFRRFLHVTMCSWKVLRQKSSFILTPDSWLLTSAVLFLFIAFPVVAHAAPNDYPVPRRIQYSFTLQNTSNKLLEKAEFWTYAPVKQTSTQLCVSIEASHPYDLIQDDLGNQVMHFTLDNLPPYATRIITVKADLRLSDKPNSMMLENPERFLVPEKFVESDDPAIIRKANSLKSPKKIFRWVSDNLRYTGYLKNDRGALYALKNKQGDCTEFAYLFTALARATGIASRAIAGYVFNRDGILKPNDYHNWSEFYEDGTWKISDPQNKVFMLNSSDYIAMRVISESPDDLMEGAHRFRFAGEGLTVKMNK